MNNRFVYIYRCIIAAFVASVSADVAFSQSLPSLRTASEISVSTLPNGISCYLVSNPSSKGTADVTLIQKGRSADFQARENLSTPVHFEYRPADFLSRNGISCQRDGYISEYPDACAFRLRRVPSTKQAVMDSTLLLVMDIAASHPGAQAIIVSGDINTGTLKDRLGIFSLMIGKRTPAAAQADYVWDPHKTLESHFNGNPSSGIATITFSTLSPRVPKQAMNTSQPLVSRMFAGELMTICERRIRSVFERNSIPLSSINFRYVTSDDTDTDESFSIRLSTAIESLDAATEKLASALSDLDLNGISEGEFKDARLRSVNTSAKELEAKMSNEQYTERCISSYLYGSTLVASSTIAKFYSTRNLPEDREAELLQRFAQAMLDPDSGATISFSLPQDYNADTSHLPVLFREAWNRRAESGYTVNLASVAEGYSDTLGVRLVQDKIKLRSSSAEAVTGGSIWTFSNGMKVIFKHRSESAGRFDFAFVLRGGLTKVPGLESGEGAFVADMLRLNKIGGIPGDDFFSMLENNGLSMKAGVDLSSLTLRGSAPSSKFMFTMRSLLSIAYARECNSDAYGYYADCERLREEQYRMTPENIRDVMDSIICPDWGYHSKKMVTKLKPDLQERAGKYFDGQFDKANDGVLIIVGDLNESALKKDLCSVLGYFRTSKQFSLRDQVPYQMRAGWSTYTVDRGGMDNPSANIAMSAQAPFTVSSHIAFRIALHVLHNSVSETMDTYGMTVRTNGRYDIFPIEKYTVNISCRPCNSSGLPADIEPSDPLSCMSALRAAIFRAGEKPVSDAVLKELRTRVQNEIEASAKRPEGMIDAAVMRYAEGKDSISGYADALKKVSAKDVQAIIISLTDGSKVEYLVK